MGLVIWVVWREIVTFEKIMFFGVTGGLQFMGGVLDLKKFRG